MRSEAADHLGKAHHYLAGARRIAAAEVPDVAAREAYLAVYHAAEAYIFEQTGKAGRRPQNLVLKTGSDDSTQ